MRVIWQGKCPRCGWSVIWRWHKHKMTCKRCPGVELDWEAHTWA